MLYRNNLQMVLVKQVFILLQDLTDIRDHEHLDRQSLVVSSLSELCSDK